MASGRFELEQLLARTRRNSDGCWLWTGPVSGGYGYFNRRIVHRLVYTLAVSEIPPGYTIDHVCHNRDSDCSGGRSCRHRRCINPAHLEAVTLAENQRRSPNNGAALQRRKTHCPQGHEYTDENTYICIDRDGGRHRQCRSCRDERAFKRRACLVAG